MPDDAVFSSLPLLHPVYVYSPKHPVLKSGTANLTNTITNVARNFA
jgi:hypothetical protein